MSAQASSREGGSRPLKVSLFGLMPPDNIGTKAWCVRPLPYLKRENIAGKVFAPSSSSLYARTQGGKRISRLPRAALYWYGLVLPRRLVQIARALRSDVIFIQRGLFRYKSPPILEMVVWILGCRLLGRRLVYHLDDAQWAVARRSYFAFRFRHAHLVITGSSHIERFARSVTSKVTVLQYGVDTQVFSPKRHRSLDPVTIGFAGLYPSWYLPLVAEALAEVCGEHPARLKVVSGERFQLPELGNGSEWEAWTPEREFSLFQDFDIGILPMPDNEFNRGKEPYKLKEYMAAGLPIVCSPVGHNSEFVRHGETGYLADSHGEWVEYLTRLVRDHELRAKLGGNGRRFVEQRHALPSQAQRLARLFHATAQGSSLSIESQAVP